MTDAILSRIPHRPPFLFLDEIVSSSAERLTATFTARPELEFFKGHYPGNPIMPGVLISEAVFQAGAVFLAGLADDAAPAGAVPVLTRIQDARFRSIVRPGDVLTIEVKLKERVGRFLFLSGLVRVGERRVMTVDFGVALTEADPARPPAG